MPEYVYGLHLIDNLERLNGHDLSYREGDASRRRPLATSGELKKSPTKPVHGGGIVPADV
jgi:hypothetical protein